MLTKQSKREIYFKLSCIYKPVQKKRLTWIDRWEGACTGTPVDPVVVCCDPKGFPCHKA